MFVCNNFSQGNLHWVSFSIASLIFKTELMRKCCVKPSISSSGKYPDILHFNYIYILFLNAHILYRTPFEQKISL